MATYNPYSDAQQIVNKKQLYNKAVASKAGDQDLYSQSAQVYYKKLRDNGFGDLADELQGADEPTALQILARYGGTTNSNRTPAVVSERPLPESGSAVNPAATPMSGNNINSGPTFNNNVKGGLSILDQYIQPSAAQQQSNSQAQSNLQATFDMFSRNNANTEARGNDLWGQMSKYGVDQSKRYDDLTGYIKNTSAVDTAEGKSIMNYYNGLGGQAAKGATANAAGANAGNIDSYSAANANRQQLSYLNSGTQAALNQKNSNVGNILSTIQSLGVDIGGLQERQIGMYQGDQKYNTDVLGKYNESQNNVAGQLQEQQNAGNGLISDYMNNLLGVNTNDAALKQTQMTNNTALKQTELQEATKITVQSMQGQTAEKQAEIAAQAALDLQEKVNAGQITINDANEAIAAIYAAANVTVSENDAAAKVTVSENNAAATTGAATINGMYDVEAAKEAAKGKAAGTDGIDLNEKYNAMTGGEKFDFLEEAFAGYIKGTKDMKPYSVSKAYHTLLELFPEKSFPGSKAIIADIAKTYGYGKSTTGKTPEEYGTDLMDPNK